MKKLFLPFICVLLLLILSTIFAKSSRISAAGFDCNTVTGVSVEECQALVALYNSTDGPNWMENTGWLAMSTPCDWYGVTCYGIGLQRLYLSGNQLSGNIPPELGNLTNLKELYLSDNQLSGNIPPELGNLTNLRWLYLYSNQLSGNIPPELGNLANLQWLYLYSNQLSGNIPPELGNLTNLLSIELYYNQLSGNIPPELGNLGNLLELFLSFNQLSGNIPPELGNLGNLEYLFLSNNQLSGNIPTELGNLANLRWLHLYGNQLSGNIPAELGELGNLDSLRLYSNPLSGSLPLIFMNLSLTHFYFDNTDLCEPIDPAFQAWLSSIPDLQRTGILCAGVSKPVVVLMHGFQGLNLDWQYSCSTGITQYQYPDPPDGAYFLDDANGDGLPKWLDEAGFEVWFAHYDTGPDYTAPVRANADCLKNQIAQVSGHDPNGEVTLIAHSMGGIVSRAYMEGDDFANDVEKLITMGSPHDGIPFDALAFLFNGVPAWVICDFYQPGLCDLSTTGMNSFNDDFSDRAYGANYFLVGGDAAYSSLSGKNKILHFLLWGPDDGLVQTTSATNPQLTDITDRFETDEPHSDDAGTFAYYTERTNGQKSLAYTDCIEPVLSQNSVNCGGNNLTFLQEPSELNARTPFEQGTLFADQTVTRTITLEGGASLFAATWQTGTFTMTLIDPNQQIINPDYAANNPNVVTYDSTSTAASYYFTNTISGTWQLILNTGSDIPVTGSSFTTFAAFDSAVILSSGVDQEWYMPGATSTVTATLSGSPTNTSIEAVIYRSDGVTDTINLLPSGGGQFQATYTIPETPGYTEIRVQATGITNGLPFERENILLFQISPESISLTQTYTDIPNPRTPESWFYESLTVTVGVNVVVSGTFGLSADLVDSEGFFVAHSVTVQNLITGTGILILRFDGLDIFTSKLNGPYTLTNLLLTDQRSATLIVAHAFTVYVTAPYPYQRFGEGKLYLPILIR